MSDHLTTRRTLLAGTLSGSALGGLAMSAADPASAVAVPTDPSSQFFLAVDGIPGDATDRIHPKTIVVLDWTFGVRSTISPTNTGRGASKSTPKGFTFVSHTDSASPKLFLACCTGKHIPQATLTARKSGSFNDYLVVTMENVYVSSYTPAPAPDDATPTESISLNFGKVKMTYTVQNPNGGVGSSVTAGFDFIKNASF